MTDGDALGSKVAGQRGGDNAHRLSDKWECIFLVVLLDALFYWLSVEEDHFF